MTTTMTTGAASATPAAHLAPGRDPDAVAVVIGTDPPLFEISIPLRVFGVDLSERGVRPYRVLAAGERPDAMSSTAGVRLELPHELDVVDGAGIVVIPGWRAPGTLPTEPALLDAVRRAYAEGALVVGLCLGTFVLADAGVLDGRPATTHWRFTARLAADHPAVAVRPDVLYVDDGQVITSAGSAAGLDACLHLVRRQRGAEAAAAVARALVVAPHRSGGQAQFAEPPLPHTGRGIDADAEVGSVVEHALAHLGDPRLDVDALAARANMSRRTFDRRFRGVVGDSPLQWLLQQRVLRAQRLLESTDLPVDAVARSVGFADAVALRPHFRRTVGVAPAVYRGSFQAS